MFMLEGKKCGHKEKSELPRRPSPHPPVRPIHLSNGPTPRLGLSKGSSDPVRPIQWSAPKEVVLES